MQKIFNDITQSTIETNNHIVTNIRHNKIMAMTMTMTMTIMAMIYLDLTMTMTMK